ncbi:acyl carrier protein [Streptomyces celluloflavus]|jgi:acyl carrier protein|uniref:Acyl carrier protein n=2 Tax=Streptomyces TaxID=1883 RepID=A0A4V2JIW3_STRKA|nr:MULTISPECIES: acyl carrier protein [Streptomyces]MYU52711.1 acyl carrier protein [Streptomyces sp. SID7805]TBO60151.1 acyl carrier protein [Streptomyces kasugaensis]WSK16568.1 acyl carrier protein [Streptomyces celluloflavus]
MPNTTSSNLDQVRNWLLARTTERDSIDPDEDLITARLVDSLSFVEFVLTIEEASGVEIDREAIDLDDFRTLKAIERKFF